MKNYLLILITILFSQQFYGDYISEDKNIANGNKPYTVHQLDSNAHIIQYNAKHIFAYAVFDTINYLNFGNIKNIDNACLIMVQANDKNNHLLLAISNPDLGLKSREYSTSVPKAIQITLNGHWDFSNNIRETSVFSSNEKETIIQITLVDGLPIEVNLNSVL